MAAALDAGSSANASTGYLGYVLIGTFLTVLLNGILSMQTHRYYTRFKRDSIWIKLLVGWTTCLALAAGSVAVAFIYIHIIVDFGAKSITAGPRSDHLFQILMALPPLSSAPTRMFYGWRVARLTKRRWIFYLVIFFALAHMVLGVYAPVLGAHHEYTTGHIVIITWTSLAIIADIALSIVVIIYIQMKRDKDTQTSSVLFRIQALTIGSGAVTSIWAVSSSILYAVTNNGLSLALFIPQATLYPCALLVCLNMRLTADGGLDVRREQTQDVNVSVKQERTVTRVIEDVGPVTSTTRTDENLQGEKHSSEIRDHSFFSDQDEAKLSRLKSNDEENNRGVYITTVGLPAVPLSLQIPSAKLEQEVDTPVRIHGPAPSVQYKIAMPQRLPTLSRHDEADEQEIDDGVRQTYRGWAQRPKKS